MKGQINNEAEVKRWPFTLPSQADSVHRAFAERRPASLQLVPAGKTTAYAFKRPRKMADCRFFPLRTLHFNSSVKEGAVT